MKRVLLASLLFMLGCSSDPTVEVAIIPEPESVLYTDERIRVSGCSFDTNDEQLSELSGRFRTRMSMPVDGDGIVIKLKLNDKLEKEQYHILVNDTIALLEAGSYPGIMYGLITMEQIYSKRTLPVIEIWDKPRFQWRGAMLDASRHFWTVAETKKFLDMMSYHKLNKFHWHLTDGIGWRIEIKKYPLLTHNGAWRREKRPEAPWTSWELTSQDDTLAYGGYYSQEDIREIIAYADSKYIEVIPEIEMPGHSDAVLDCYPNLKCFGGSERVGEFCAGKEATYEFLFNVLDEVAGLFPSKYIHVGGDEVSTNHWALCPDCQKIMEKEKIFGVDKLQGYFIRRIKDHLEQRDKVVCGWDEIVDVGADSNIVVFSWTGMENGAIAAKNGNKVVMCPLDYVYFDHYQGFHKDEPQGWGGNNRLSRVYDFPVIPKGLDEKSAQNIMGGQANLWTENISTFEHVQYMMLPRMAALSEALWSTPENKSWDRFRRKIGAQTERYRSLGWKYSSSPVDVEISDSRVDSDGAVHVDLGTELGTLAIRYTLDGSLPTVHSSLYDTTLVLETRQTLMAASFFNDSIVGRVIMYTNLKSKSSGRPVKYNSAYGASYSGGGEKALTDSKVAFKRGDDSAWQGFEKVNFNIEIDLGEMQTINQACGRFFQHIGATSVMLPKTIIVSVSDDGKKWSKVAKQEVGQIDNHDAMVFVAKLEFVPTQARYVKIEAINVGVLPPWHARVGANAWIFVDEISIN